MRVDTKNWQVPDCIVKQFFKKKNKYCLVIPVINEGEKIKKELQELKFFSKQIDIILADGGSSDGSTDEKFIKKQNIRAILTGPMGQSRQYRFAFAWALRQNYQGIVTIDGNHKDDVTALPLFVKALDEGYDYVQSSRFIKGGKHQYTPQDRIFFNRFFISPLLSLGARHWYTDTPNAFRSYSRKYLLDKGVQPFRDIFQRYELLFYLTTRANRLGLKTKEVPVTRKYPKGQIPTKIVGWKKVNDMFNIVRIALGFYNP